MERQHRYNERGAAAMAGAGEGKDEPAPHATARAKLRDQALEWLKADRAARAKLLDRVPREARPQIAQVLQHWKTDSDLAGVREPARLAKLPDEERKAWKALWAEVDAMLAKLQGPAAAR